MNQSIIEKPVWNQSVLVGLAVLFAPALVFFMMFPIQMLPFFMVPGVIWFIVITSGFVVVQPLEGRVVQFFGNYMGTIREAGPRWTIPFTTKFSLSLRLRNFESPKLKVNDAEGNPIEIAAIIVWKVIDTGKASFNVDSLDRFVEKQTESALRVLSTRYPYDKHQDHEISLHGNIDVVNEQLRLQVGKSLSEAGVQIVEARISHLAYAPEIAAAMLQRQQAQAVIAARQKIVEGAVGMVDMALKQLLKNGIVQLDEERKAAMVSNLLVVLCSERSTQPVLNAGSIY
jgi:regulator of protease activity HflC (stomatin/prohibitin superfamily)